MKTEGFPAHDKNQRYFQSMKTEGYPAQLKTEGYPAQLGLFCSCLFNTACFLCWKISKATTNFTTQAVQPGCYPVELPFPSKKTNQSSLPCLGQQHLLALHALQGQEGILQAFSHSCLFGACFEESCHLFQSLLPIHLDLLGFLDHWLAQLLACVQQSFQVGCL